MDMNQLIGAIPKSFKEKSIFIAFMIFSVFTIWDSYQKNNDALLQLNVSTVKALQENTNALKNINEVFRNSSDAQKEFWLEKHEDMMLELEEIKEEIQEVKEKIK